MNKKDLPIDYQPSQPKVRLGACPYRLSNSATRYSCGCLKQDCLAFSLEDVDGIIRPWCNAINKLID